MAPTGSHIIPGVQDFILSHFLHENVQIYCGHSGEGYNGKVVDCVDGVVTLERGGRNMYIVCDKIESFQPA